MSNLTDGITTFAEGKRDPHRIPCKTIFSNGMEFEMFMEHCFECARYRNDHCRILNACYKAMWDKDAFPYDDLLEWSNGYGGKTCKHYTEDRQARNRSVKQTKGQMSLCLNTSN